MQRSQDHVNPAATSKGVIVLYDSAFQNEEYLARILAHELAHQIFGSYSRNNRIFFISAQYSQANQSTCLSMD